MKSKKENIKKTKLLFLCQLYLLIFLFFIISLTKIAIAQPAFGQQWIKYSGNPLLNFVGEPLDNFDLSLYINKL